MSRVEALKAELNKTKKDFNILVGLISYMAGRLNLHDLDNEDPHETLVKISNEFTERYGHEPINWVPIGQVLDDGPTDIITKDYILDILSRESRDFPKEIWELKF